MSRNKKPFEPEIEKTQEVVPIASRSEGVELFVRQYLINGNNAAEAARLVGRKNGLEFLKTKSVQTELNRQLALMFRRMNITKERIIDELGAIAFLDIGDLLDEDGNVRKISEIPEHARRAIASIEIKELFQRDGKGLELIGHLKKFNVESKIKALELLGKYFSMFEDKVTVEHKGAVAAINVEPFDAEDRIKQLIEAQSADVLL